MLVTYSLSGSMLFPGSVHKINGILTFDDGSTQDYACIFEPKEDDVASVDLSGTLIIKSEGTFTCTMTSYLYPEITKDITIKTGGVSGTQLFYLPKYSGSTRNLTPYTGNTLLNDMVSWVAVDGEGTFDTSKIRVDTALIYSSGIAYLNLGQLITDPLISRNTQDLTIQVSNEEYGVNWIMKLDSPSSQTSSSSIMRVKRDANDPSDKWGTIFDNIDYFDNNGVIELTITFLTSSNLIAWT